jgi:ribosomal protein S18 acetylase RimI-like enzyme
MRFQERPFSGESHVRAMLDIVALSPRDNLHVVDLPYRFSSWALDDPRNAALWMDSRGRLAAWAVLQTPFWAIDSAVRSGAEADLFSRVLDWANARASAVVGTLYARSTWYVHVFADQVERCRRLEQAGFACQADVGEDSWSRVLLERTSAPPGVAPTPSGFTIRPLAGASEVDAYVELHRAAFDSTNMTGAWRERTLARPEYVRDIDLVTRAPDGRLAAFCVGWLLPEKQAIGQIEPLGVGREFREAGIGRAILYENLRRLARLGAATVLVETDTYRSPALDLYESAGFEPIRNIHVFRKDATGEVPAPRGGLRHCPDIPRVGVNSPTTGI